MSRPPTRQRGGGRGGGGGAEKPIDLSGLKAVDANVKLTANSVQVGSVALKNLEVDAKLVNGALQATIGQVTVNGAPGSGKLTVDASGKQPAISGAVKMDGLDVGAILNLAGVAAPVSGSAGVDVAFKTSGDTGSALAANLDASGKVSLANGKVTGLNLADAVGGDKTANEIDNVDVTASFKSLTSPITATGALTWRKVRFTISGNADMRALLAGKTTDVAVKASSKTVDFGFTGKAGIGGLGDGARSAWRRRRCAICWPGSAGRSEVAAVCRRSRSRARWRWPRTPFPSTGHPSHSTSRAASAPAR